MTESMMDQFEQIEARPMIDHFAGLAMQSLMHTDEGRYYIMKESYDQVAENAYGMATSMMYVRRRLMSEGSI